MTLARISGSPIALYSHDFNPALLTGDGEWVYTGAFLQVLSAACESGIRWVLEHYHENPGIAEGDSFLTNDPWVGAMHQQDVNLLHPVFIEGVLFCWVGNSLHQYDLGGQLPGSFCPNAPDVFSESTPIPPVKIVEGGTLRDDLERMYLRRSRTPDLVALDLRAQIAACRAAEARIVALVARYGPETVQAVMARTIDNAELAFIDRMRDVEDGRWSERNYLQIAREGDRGVYPVVLTAVKQDTELYFHNEGTHGQVGALNNTVLGWRGGIMTAINQIFLFDQMCAIGGALRHIHFDHRPGLITCADFPAAVSCAPPTATLLTQGQALRCLSRMVSESPRLASEANAPYAGTQFPIVSFQGIDQRGEPTAGIFLDPMSGGLGAFSDHDGIDTGGFPPDPMSMAPNIEFNEQSQPVLYLYCRELPDSGGAGAYRGGNSCVQAFTLHDTERLDIAVTPSGVALPTSLGLWGGFPGCTTSYRVLLDSDIGQRLQDGTIPQSVEEIDGTELRLPVDAPTVSMTPGSVLEFRTAGSAGYGDPYLRVPDRVAEDVRNGAVSPESARNIYGVVLDENGEPDIEATTAARGRRLHEGGPLEPTVETRGGVAHCRTCRVPLGEGRGDYADGCTVEVVDLRSVVPLAIDASVFVDDPPQLARRSCPSCGALVEVAFA
jgi:N-methylhydantoinase B